VEQQTISYAAIAVSIVGFILQFNIFSRPVDLEKKHREILKEVSNDYATKESLNNIEKDVSEMKTEMKEQRSILDKIYRLLKKEP
jgi:DNA-binding transcriptional regulator GbsR (MarR family)